MDKCERCGRFVGEEALEGWSGGLFGDYNGRLYCAFGVGCNSVESAAERNPLDLALFGTEPGAAPAGVCEEER